MYGDMTFHFWDTIKCILMLYSCNHWFCTIFRVICPLIWTWCGIWFTLNNCVTFTQNYAFNILNGVIRNMKTLFWNSHNTHVVIWTKFEWSVPKYSVPKGTIQFFLEFFTSNSRFERDNAYSWYFSLNILK